MPRTKKLQVTELRRLYRSDAALCTRAADTMVTLQMQSDELARFLIHTIATNKHSTDVIAESFSLRDPAVLQRLLFRSLETDTKCRRRVLEVSSKIVVTDVATQLPTLLQVLPEPQVRAYTSSSMSAPAACLCQPRLFVSHGVIDTSCERASNSIWLQVGGLVCRMVIEAFRREHAMDPMWRIPERLEMHMQRLHKAFPDCVDVPYALRELRMLGALKTKK
jgi:hypothetical protein